MVLRRLAESPEDVDAEVRGRLRGLHDRALRVTEQLAGFRELLTNVLNVNLTLIGINQNDQMTAPERLAA